MQSASPSARSGTNELADDEARLIDALCRKADAAVAAVKELAEHTDDNRARRALRTARGHLERAKGLVEAVRTAKHHL